MRTVTKSLSAAGASPAIPVDWRISPFQLALAVNLTNTPTLTYNVEYTTDDLQNGAPVNWYAVSGLSALTASKDGALSDRPATAVRLNVTAYTAGTATLSVLQSGIAG